MAKSKEKLDSRQLSLFDYDRKIEDYVALKTEILRSPEKADKEAHSWEEDCIAIAAAIKSAIKKSGLSREQIVEAVNDYYGWSQEISDCRSDISKKGKGKKAQTGKRLTIHMFNHFLSKPTKYPIQAYYIFAIQSITKSLEPCISFAEAENAQVISGDEKRALTLGKIDDHILELQRLKKELRGKGR